MLQLLLLLVVSVFHVQGGSRSKGEVGHLKIPGEVVIPFVNAFLNEETEEARSLRRELAQQWEQFNKYFSGDPSKPSPLNLPTYYGQFPGPCPLSTTPNFHDLEKCFARAKDMEEEIRQIQICIPVLGCKRVDEWINCDSESKPGNIWLYDLDFGNLHLGGIYLDIIESDFSDGSDRQTTKEFADESSPYQSEISFRNEFRMTFTLNELQFDSALLTDVEKLEFIVPQLLRFLSTFTQERIYVDLKNDRQAISDSAHAVSFRSVIHFRANKYCRASSNRDYDIPENYDTTCMYRADKVTKTTRGNYYRPKDDRTESFLEGVVYDLNLPRKGDRSTWTPTTQYDKTSCQFDFKNQYASQNPGEMHRTDLGLNVDIGPWCKSILFLGTDPCRFLINVFLDLFIVAIIKSIFCDLFRGLFWIPIDYRRSIQPSEEPGLLNIGMRKVYKFFKKYVETPLITKADEEKIEDVTMPDLFTKDGYVWPHTNCATTGWCPYPDAFDFNNSALFKAVSLGLNGILGNKSTTPGYEDKLVIVETIDILLGNTNGVLQLGICNGDDPGTCTLGYCAGTCDGDIKDELKLQDYPHVSWGDQPVFNGKIQLNGLLIYGLNSITQMNLLDNNFESAVNPLPDFTHTVKNTFSMTKLGIQAFIVVTLSDGDWVHRPRFQTPSRIRTIDIATNILVELANIQLKADLFMLLNVDPLKPKYIGSVFGNWPSGNLTKRLNCAAFALDMLQIQKLEVAGALARLEFLDLLGSLGDVISTGSEIFNLGYVSATNIYLPMLADSLVRPTINEYLYNNTYDGPCGPRVGKALTSVNSNCTRPLSLDVCQLNWPYYFSDTDPNRYINFYDSKAWSVIKGVVNNVVGGIPVRTGSASINSLIHNYLIYYVPLAAFENVTIELLPNNPAGQEMGNIDVTSEEFVFDGSDFENHHAVFNQFGLRNLETIHELSVNPTSASNPSIFRVDFKIGGGKIYDRNNKVYIQNGLFKIKFHMDVKVENTDGVSIFNYAEDQADFLIEFGNLTVGADAFALINQNTFLDLRFGDLIALSCLFAVVEAFKLESLFFGFESFRLTIDRTKPGYRHRDQFCSNKWIVNPSNLSNPTPNFGTPCLNSPSEILRFSDAIDYLAYEATTWGPRVDNMLKYLFRGASGTVMRVVNRFNGYGLPAANCSNYTLAASETLKTLRQNLTNASQTVQSFFDFLEKASEYQENPRFPKFLPSTPYGATASGPFAIVYRPPTPSGAPTYEEGDEAEINKIGYPAAITTDGFPDCSPKVHYRQPEDTTRNTCWESDVVIPRPEEALDLRNNFVVDEIQKFLKRSGQKVVIEALNAIASTSGNFLGDSLTSYPYGAQLPNGRGVCNNTAGGEKSYCIDLLADLTGLVPVFNNSEVIPGLFIDPKRLRVENLHAFQADPESFNLFYNYIPDQYRPSGKKDTDSQFTLAHRIKFGGQKISFLVDIDVSVAEEFLNLNTPTPSNPVTDTITLSFSLTDMDFHFMTTTAINATRLNEIPFYYLTRPFETRERCFYSMFFKKGLYLPQLQLYIKDIVGPTTTIKGKSPASPISNIFSKGVGYLLAASIELFFQILKEDFPNFTQGSLRNYVNRVLDDTVQRGRNAAGPGSCPLPAPCGPEDSMCHYVQFFNSSFDDSFDVMNTIIGGNPVKSSLLDVNNLVDVGVNYAIVSPTGARALGESIAVTHPQKGDFIFPVPVNYINEGSRVKLTNVGIVGLDSIFYLQFQRFSYAPYSLGLELMIGNGTMLNGTNQPPTEFRGRPLTIQMELDMLVVTKRPIGFETLANNAFRVELSFENVTLESIQEMLVNKTDINRMSIQQVSNGQCILAIVDSVTMESFTIAIADFNVNIPPYGNGVGQFGRNILSCPTHSPTNECHIGTAINKLRSEAAGTNAISPPGKSVPTSMLNAVLRNIGDVVISGVNGANFFNATSQNCEVPKVILNVIGGVTNKNDSITLVDYLLKNVTGILKSPPPLISDDFSTLTVQSSRAKTSAGRTSFIADVTAAAKRYRGTSRNSIQAILEVGSFCDTLNLPVFISPLCTAVVEGTNFTALYESWAIAQGNPIEDNLSPVVIENDVTIDLNSDQYYDIRRSQIVKSTTAYFDKHSNNFNELLRSIALKNVTSSKMFILESDGSVTLQLNMTDAILFIDQTFLSGQTCEGATKTSSFLLSSILETTNSIIPSFRVLPGFLTVKNFGQFSELVLFRPYKTAQAEARFTTQHELGWRRQPLHISLDVDLFYDEAFTTGGVIPSGVQAKENVNITMTIEGLLIQALTLLAVNTKTLGSVSLGDFLQVDKYQNFTKNCKAFTCLMGAGVFPGGMSLPQFTINVTNIIGPRFRSTRQLFSEGMELFVDALLEIGIQLTKDDLSSLTQGPVRKSINNMLTKTLTDSKKAGACPGKKNYTGVFPRGAFFCSHNKSEDATSTVGLKLTHNKKECESKYDGKTCYWAPPDGDIDENTVACFYTLESQDLNFQTASALKTLASFVNSSLLDPDSAYYINGFLEVFSKDVTIEQILNFENIPLKYNGNNYGSMDFFVGAVSFKGLDTVKRIQIFDPYPFGPEGDARFRNPAEYEPPSKAPTAAKSGRRLYLDEGRKLSIAEDFGFELSTVDENRRELAAISIIDSFGYEDNKYASRTAVGFEGPLSLSLQIYWRFDKLFIPKPGETRTETQNRISLELTLSNADFSLDFYMLVNIARLMDLQIRSISTIYELPCILAIFEDNGLIPFRANITFERAGFRVCCIGTCDASMFSILQNNNCFDETKSPSIAKSFTSNLKEFVDFVIGFIASTGTQDFLNNQISISNTQCDAIKIGITIPETGDVAEQDTASAFGIAGLALLFANIIGFALLVPVHFRRRDELMKSALLDAHERGAAGKSKDEFELAERRLKSAFDHPLMPRLAKFGVPFTILLNVVFFATANFAANGAVVELELSIAGDTTYPVTLLPFTLARSINDMWNAGVYPLAIIIALTSGGWPYAKQFLLLVCWFAPSTILHPKSRGRFLEILDVLGKWSLVDIYVLVLLMVAFKFFITSTMVQSVSLLPEDAIKIVVTVVPGWGIYGFCFGAMGSLLVNHVMTWYHRKVIRADEDFQDAILGILVKDLRTPRIPLSKHRFNILDAEGRPYRYSVFVRVCVVAGLVFTFILIIVGAILPAMNFAFKGLAGIAISLIDPELASNTQSVGSIGTSIINGAKASALSQLSVIFLQILYILFALVIPLALCLLLIGIWVVPLTLREQILLLFLAEILSAWEASLVLSFSLVAAVLQLSQLAQFIVNASTGSVCTLLEQELERFFPDPSDAKCFDVIATLLPTGAVYIGAACLVFVMGFIAFRLMGAAVEDRELAMRRKPPHSPGEMTGCTGFLVRRSLEAFGISQIEQAGGIANHYAQGQGAFDRESKLVPSWKSSDSLHNNPVMQRELTGTSQMQASNPLFRSSHQSVDV